jgi:dTDP-4-dehydrorhamnose 3,5-epimerase
VKLTATSLSGALVIEPTVFEDERGFFFESWSAREFARSVTADPFVQDNHSRSARGVLRGLHYQKPNEQGKLVRVVNGAVFDVIVDLRTRSATFGHWFGVELSASNRLMLWVPPGFAHGFLSLEDETDLLYKCTDYYHPEAEHTLLWNDPKLAIGWPLHGMNPIVSQKDRDGQCLADLETFG